MSDPDDDPREDVDAPGHRTKDAIFYRGKSMQPTFRNFDLLHLSSPQARTIRPGDIIAFRLPDQSMIFVHRVIAIQDGGIVTRGDANYEHDASPVHTEDIIGLVTSLERDGHMHRVLTGYVGLLSVYVLRVLRLTQRSISRTLFPPFRKMYRRLSQWGILGTILCFHHFTRIGVLHTPQGVHLQLLVGKRTIGWLRPPYRRWAITPPFHLVVNQAQLPKNINDIVGKKK